MWRGNWVYAITLLLAVFQLHCFSIDSPGSNMSQAGSLSATLSSPIVDAAQLGWRVLKPHFEVHAADDLILTLTLTLTLIEAFTLLLI